MGEKPKCTFLLPRDLKYPKGNHSNRAAGDGFWRPNAVEKQVKDSTNAVIGFKQTLVFYKEKFPKADKTNCNMHEYRIINPHSRTRIDENYMKVCTFSFFFFQTVKINCCNHLVLCSFDLKLTITTFSYSPVRRLGSMLGL
jgi:hypothetical protein